MVRHKMDRAERAKQFMPFAALKGYSEALRKKEREIEYQRLLNEQGEAYEDIREEEAYEEEI